MTGPERGRTTSITGPERGRTTSQKPDSGHPGTTNPKIRASQLRWNDMKPQFDVALGH
jgi:hypothetical protein